MRVSFNLNPDKFSRECEAIITKVGKNTRKGTEEACRIISAESLRQVPRETNTLAASQFYNVTGYYETGWTGVVGYGGNGDPVNPKTGNRASDYMLAVHEDLTARHPIGKAKYLEDPVREFGRERFPRTVYKYVQAALGE